MTETLTKLQHDYERALGQYLADPTEASLGEAYALGRAALGEGLSMLDLVNVHHQVLADAVEAGGSRSRLTTAIDAGGHFLLEALSSFEMAGRGFREAQLAARVEHAHAASLRGLADTAVAINAERDAESIVSLVSDVARNLLEARAALITVALDKPDGALRARSLDARFEGWEPTSLIGPGFAEAARRRSAPTRRGADELEPLAAEIGYSLNGWLAIPLRARDERLIGLLEVADREEGEFTDNDEAMAVQLAQMTSGALENVRLYEREHHIAETLQQSLLPARLPQVPGATVAASYRAAGEAQEVGGDFYDVFEVDDHRWLLVIGDVCGKGPQAASITALARYTVRATALRETDPVDILATLNRAMLAQLPSMYFASVACASLTVAEGRVALEVGCGGHPLPMVRRASGSIEEVGEYGTLLGVVDDPHLPVAAVELAPGDAFVLYTDGVFDTGRTGLPQWGPGRVQELLEAAPAGDAATIVRILETTAVEQQAGFPRDDIAILVAARQR